jgi:hypothetical protein
MTILLTVITQLILLNLLNLRWPATCCPVMTLCFDISLPARPAYSYIKRISDPFSNL